MERAGKKDHRRAQEAEGGLNREQILRDFEVLKRETRDLVNSPLWAKGAEKFPEHYGYDPYNHTGSNAGRRE